MSRHRMRATREKMPNKRLQPTLGTPRAAEAQRSADGIRASPRTTVRILRETENFRITHDYEFVRAIDNRSGARIDLGSHYGDPTDAIVSMDERWIIVIGDGITAKEIDGELHEFFR